MATPHLIIQQERNASTLLAERNMLPTNKDENEKASTETVDAYFFNKGAAVKGVVFKVKKKFFY